MPSFEGLCQFSCVDFAGSIDISGRADLRKIPILSKIRSIRSLGIDVDGLPSLVGLEKLETIGNMNLSSASQGKDDTFRSLDGLRAGSIERFTIDRISSLPDLAAAQLSHVGVLSADSSGLQSVDLTGLEITAVVLNGNQRLRSLALPSSAMGGVEVSVNSLSELSWGPGLRVSRSLRFFQNPNLSTCTIRQLESEAVLDAGVTVYIAGNGPCP